MSITSGPIYRMTDSAPPWVCLHQLAVEDPCVLAVIATPDDWRVSTMTVFSERMVAEIVQTFGRRYSEVSSLATWLVSNGCLVGL
jgi:hypothetical protein